MMAKRAIRIELHRRICTDRDVDYERKESHTNEYGTVRLGRGNAM
jgi:hypothetical protein